MTDSKHYRCRAKDIMHCPYHGSAIRMELTAAQGDYEGYQAAKDEFERAASAMHVRGGLLSAFTGEETVPNPATSPTNPMRFSAYVDIKPKAGSNATLTHRINVHAATREATLDKLVHATKAYVDELRAGRQRLSWKRDDYDVTISVPDLDGRKDDDANMSGGSRSLNGLVASVGLQRQLAVQYFNLHALVGKASQGKLTAAEKKYYDNHQSDSIHYGAQEADWLRPKFSAAQNIWQGESHAERQKRHDHDDWYRDVRRQRAQQARANQAREAKKSTARAGSMQAVADDQTQQALFNAALLSTVNDTAPHHVNGHGDQGHNPGYDHSPSYDQSPNYDPTPSYDSGSSYASDSGGGDSGGGGSD